ncbi:MAG: flagellar hook protein [Robiginitomaculum sp.]|nr:MAG: flagellar hook protein [Robiginitomaculum sp.]
MSLYSALSIGVQGLRSNSTALGGISNNIANINTIGYKRTRSDFSSLVTSETPVVLTGGGGVTVKGSRLVSQQGLIQPSASNTDLAISGKGFFAVTSDTIPSGVTPDLQFTRAGSFSPDSEGNLRNTSGLYLQGWRAQTDGTFVTNPTDTVALTTVNIGSISGAAVATNNIAMNGNLRAGQAISTAAATYVPTASATNMASGAVAADFERIGQVFDSQGNVRSLNMAFLKDATAPNTWNVELYASPVTDVDLGAGLVDGQLATGQIVFNADGTLDTVNSTFPSSISILASDSGVPAAGAIKWATAEGIAAQTLNFNLAGVNGIGGLTQFEAPSILETASVDGSPYGELIGVTVDDKGFLSANFNNGISRKIYQIPLATFINPNGLIAANGDAYRATSVAGSLNLREAGIAAGTLSAQALEGSNVDLAQEFTDLIAVQRAYSASSKIITTADEMLDELIRIKR